MTSNVHVLGVSHDSPINPRAINEITNIVKPDAFAMEGTEEMRNPFRKAAGSEYLLPLLNRLQQTPIIGLKAAHGLLSQGERDRWRLGLASAGIAIGEGDAELHYVGGRIIHSDILTGDELIIQTSCM